MQAARPRRESKTPKGSTIGRERARPVRSSSGRREGGDLRADEVFEKASGAVYVVRADNRQGSAVAISESELLTNCHVVGSRAR